MGKRGPKPINPGELYAFAHQFYWDFRRLAEGRWRRRLDERKYQRLANDSAREAEYVRITPQDRAHHEEMVQQEIFAGRLDPGQKEARLRDIEDGLRWARAADYRGWAGEQATKQLRIPGEPDAMKVLLDPNTTPEQVRELCKDAFMTRMFEVQPGVLKEVQVSAWPIPTGSPLPTYLSQYAEQFVAALRDSRFPRCDVATRPSTRLKQLWFLSRALAGALFGVTTRTAINLVGSIRPEQVFADSRAAKAARRKRRKK